MRKNKNKSGYSLFSWIKGLMFGMNTMESAPTKSVLEEEQMQSPFRTVVNNFLGNKGAVCAVLVFVAIFSACFIFPMLYPLDLSYGDITQQNIAPGFSMMRMPSKLKNNIGVVSPGSTFGVGVDNEGKVYIYGKLPDKKLNEIPENMGKIVDISAGLNHVLALNEEGKLFTWGYSRFNLGKIPLDVKDLSGEIVQIGAGYQISYVVSDKGELVYWGNDNLMDISLSEVKNNVAKAIFNTSTGIVLTKEGGVVALCKNEQPVKNVPEQAMKDIVDIAITEKAAAAVTKDGQIITWGGGSNGELDVPEELQGKAVAVEGGRNHFTALTSEGKVYSWGVNNYGQTAVPKAVKNATIVKIISDYHQNYAFSDKGEVFTWGLKGYLMGTDGAGRDIFTRLVAGGRMTMTVGAIAVIISAVIGIIVGGFAGYYGGVVDNLLMRLAEIVGALPFLPFAMILSAIIGNTISETQRIMVIMVILGILTWPGIARLIRAQILAEREKEFVTAAKAVGINEFAIIFKHILPNVITVIIVNITLQFASSMLIESTLSFIGFGVIEPNPTWGNMLKGCQDSKIISEFWWRWVFPAAALSLSTISINIMGEGLREAIDPYSNDR